MFTQKLQAHVVCNLRCIFETEGLLNVTGSHVHCKRGNISVAAKVIIR